MRTIVTLLIALGTPVVAAAQELPGDPAAGAEVASRQCSECHAVRPGRAASRVSAAPSFQSIADRPTTTAVALRVFLRTPHADMPDVMLSPQQADAVISYILAMKRR